MRTRTKFTKKILSIFLCVVMLLSYVPMAAFAADGDPCTEPDCTGTYKGGICTSESTHYEQPTETTDKYDIDGDDIKDTVYEISNEGQLRWLAVQVKSGNLSLNAVLTADITLTTAWTRIGDLEHRYSGIFDGQNHTVNFAFHSTEYKDYSGLFGYSTGIIKNVKVYNFVGNYGNYNNVAAVVGCNEGTINNCVNLGVANDTMFSVGSYGGGIAGNNNGGTIENCISYIPIYVQSCSGGIAGGNQSEGTIKNCINYGEITAYDQNHGGIVGENYEGTVENCVNYGEFGNGGRSSFVGGIAGSNRYGNMINCLNSAYVCGAQYTGGIAGYNDGEITYCKNNGHVESIRSDDYHGGIVGSNFGTISACFNSGEICGASTGGCVGGIAGYNGSSNIIENCANTGYINISRAGAIVGENGGSINSCYNYGELKAGAYGVVRWNEGSLSNVYYKNGSVFYFSTTDATATKMTEEQFASGEVAYLLNNKVFDGTQVWYQNIDNGQTVDSYPVLDNTSGTIYRKCNGTSYIYSNSNEGSVHNFTGECDTICDICEYTREVSVGHIEGTQANCNRGAICSVCGSVYGEKSGEHDVNEETAVCRICNHQFALKYLPLGQTTPLYTDNANTAIDACIGRSNQGVSGGTVTLFANATYSGDFNSQMQVCTSTIVLNGHTFTLSGKGIALYSTQLIIDGTKGGTLDCTNGSPIKWYDNGIVKIIGNPSYKQNGSDVALKYAGFSSTTPTIDLTEYTGSGFTFTQDLRASITVKLSDKYTLVNANTGETISSADVVNGVTAKVVYNHTHDWEYTVSGTTITATCENTDGYCTGTNGGSVKLSVEDAYYTGNSVSATVTDNFTNGATFKVTYNGAETAPNSVGTYNAKLTVYENGAEKQSITAQYKISYLPAPENAYNISGYSYYDATNKTHWFKIGDTVTVNAPADYEISTALDGIYGSSVSFYESDNKVIYLQRISDGALTDSIHIEGVRFDGNGADGKITIEDRGFWEKLFNKITFGLFFKGDAVAKVSAMDDESGWKSIQYYVADEDLIADDMLGHTAAVAKLEGAIGNNWNTYNNEIALNKNAKNVIYVKITDNVGNVSYLSSEGIVLYSDTEAVTESISATYKAGEDKDVAVELNGNTVNEIKNGTADLTAGSDYTVSADGTITLKASYLDTLNAGTYTFTVSYNPLDMEYVGANGNDAPATTTFKVVIEKADGKVSNINISGMTYDGTAVEAPTFDKLGDGAATIEYKVKGAEDSAYTATAPKNAGDWVVRVAVAEGTNYKAASATAEFTISRATLDDVSVQQNGKLTYDGGKTLTPTVATNAMALNGEKVLFIYSADGTTYGSMPTFTGAGTYTVHYCAYTVDNNFIDYYGTFTVSIDKAIVTVPTIASKPYNSSVQTADISDTDFYTVAKNEGGKAKGSYDVLLKLKDADNYKWSTADNAEVTVQFVITAAQNSWNIQPAISGWTYGETAKVPTHEAKFGDVKIVYSGKANDGTDYSSETAPTKAGSYTATFTVKETEDYSGLSQQVNFAIAKATYDMTSAKWDYTKAFAYDGREKVLSVSGLPSGVTVKSYTGNMATVVGDYTAKVIFNYDSNNYNEPVLANLSWSIKNDWIPAEYSVSTPNSHGWLNNEFVIKAADGYKVSLTNTADGDWKDSLTYSAETADGSVTFYLMNETDGTISLDTTVNYKLDKTAPTGKVEFVERSSWEDFVNTITFGLFYKDEVTVKAEAADALSGIAKLEYASSDKTMTLEEVQSITDWEEYTDNFGVALEDAKKFVYFIRITDKAGNATYLSTDGAEYDTTAPVIEGVEDSSTYYTTQKVIVKDKNIDQITLDGQSVTGEITLEGNVDETYTIIAIDKAGNETKVIVTMKKIDAIKAPITEIKEEDVKSSDKGTIQGVITQVDELLKDDDLTAEEKEELEGIKDDAEKLIGQNGKIEEALKDVTDKIDDFNQDNVRADDKKELTDLIGDIDELLKGDNLTDEERKSLEDTKKKAEDLIAKIQKMESPSTGDFNQIWIWFAFAFVSGGFTVVHVILEKKRNGKK